MALKWLGWCSSASPSPKTSQALILCNWNIGLSLFSFFEVVSATHLIRGEK